MATTPNGMSDVPLDNPPSSSAARLTNRSRCEHQHGVKVKLGKIITYRTVLIVTIYEQSVNEKNLHLKQICIIQLKYSSCRFS